MSGPRRPSTRYVARPYGQKNRRHHPSEETAMYEPAQPPARLEVRLLASPDPTLTGALTTAGLQSIGRFGVADIWVPVDRPDGSVAP